MARSTAQHARPLMGVQTRLGAEELAVIQTGSQIPPLSTRTLVISAFLVSLGAAVGQGFARFGYALLLTPMRSSLSWSYGQAGLVNSGNALGYLIGSLIVGPAVARWGASRVIRASLVTVSISLITTGLFDHLILLLVSRIAAGVGAGLLFIAGASVVLALDSSGHGDLPIGIYYAGPGIGIAFSGLLVPLVLGPLGWDWRAVWIALGSLGFLTLLAVEVPLRTARRVAPTPAMVYRERLFVLTDYLHLWPELTAYTLFGLGYIGYMTFVIAFLGSINVSPALRHSFWVLLGLCAACSGFTGRPLIRYLRPHHALSALLIALSLGALLPVVFPWRWSVVLSAVLFGSAFLAIVTVITLAVRTRIPQARWTAVMGNATFLFALGQFVGPTLTGVVADMRGGLGLGLLGSAAMLSLGAVVALCRGLTELT